MSNIDSTEGDTNHTSRRTEWHSVQSKEVAKVLDEDSQYFIHQPLSTPCLSAISSACGSYFYDVDGKGYLDLHGNSVHQVGYRHPHVVEAVKRQIDELPFSPRRFANPQAVRLARRLVEKSSIPDAKVLFAPGGATAIGIALKVARLATGRYKTISMWGSFHGGSLDTIALGGEQHFRKGIGPLTSGAEHAPPCDVRRCPLKCGTSCNLACANYVRYMLETEGDVSAVIVEPLRATTVVKPPLEYWQILRDACDQTGTLLIFDEIPTCLGRTGTFSSGDQTGVVPDITVIGKGLGGAIIPIAAVLARGDLCNGLETSLGHYTHEKSPVGCAAGNAVLDVIEAEGLVSEAIRKGRQFVEGLEELATVSEHIKEVRGYGLQLGVELSSSEKSEEVLYRCFEQGLNLKVSVGNVLTLTPPLTITDEETEFALQAIRTAILAL